MRIELPRRQVAKLNKDYCASCFSCGKRINASIWCLSVRLSVRPSDCTCAVGHMLKVTYQRAAPTQPALLSEGLSEGRCTCIYLIYLQSIQDTHYRSETARTR